MGATPPCRFPSPDGVAVVASVHDGLAIGLQVSIQHWFVLAEIRGVCTGKNASRRVASGIVGDRDVREKTGRGTPMAWAICRRVGFAPCASTRTGLRSIIRYSWSRRGLAESCQSSAPQATTGRARERARSKDASFAPKIGRQVGPGGASQVFAFVTAPLRSF